MLTAALAALAIVAQDQVALRAAPRDSAPQQAVLWQGDSLEIRGEKGDFLQVYDHRRERAGYVRAAQVHPESLAADNAPALRAVVQFLRDTPGAESLGIAYAAAYLKAAPAEQIDGAIFDALGTLSDRLAQSASNPRRNGEAVAAHLEVAAAYGVTMVGIERDGRVQLCYEGDAHRRVLALPADDAQKARAALALTRHECVPELTPTERFTYDEHRAELLDRVPLAALPEVMKNRLHLRKAGVWASLAWQRERRPDADARAVQEAGSRALDEMAAVNKGELMESDQEAWNEAAVRVGASRWAADAQLAPAGEKLSIAVSAGNPGEHCVHLVDAKHDAAHPLFTRCTYGIVWSASATANADGSALALAVQPLDTWRELWLFRRGTDGWSVDVLPPAAENSAPGYVEFAGWVPGGGQLLVAREAKSEGRFRQGFETVSMATLATEKRADRPANLSLFYRWQSPQWKAHTVALR